METNSESSNFFFYLYPCNNIAREFRDDEVTSIICTNGKRYPTKRQVVAYLIGILSRGIRMVSLFFSLFLSLSFPRGRYSSVLSDRRLNRRGRRYRNRRPPRNAPESSVVWNSTDDNTIAGSDSTRSLELCSWLFASREKPRT